MLLYSLSEIGSKSELDESLKRLIYEEFIFIIDKKLRKCDEGDDLQMGIRLFRAIDLIFGKLNVGMGLILYTLHFFKLKKSYTIYSYLSMTLLNKIATDPKNVFEFFTGLIKKEVIFSLNFLRNFMKWSSRL